MKIIDLLTKMANGEKVPKKICYDDIIYILIDNGIYSWYKNKEDNEGFLDNANVKDFLNDEVEIIEEDKKIEKIKERNNPTSCTLQRQIEVLDEESCKIKKKINELIDEVNKLKEK